MTKNSRTGLWASIRNKTVILTFYQKLSLLISTLGLLSLVLIVRQIQLTTFSMQASMYATIATQTLELDKLFIEHPKLRPYFYEGKDILAEKSTDPEKYDRVMAIAEYKADLFDSIKTQLDYIPKDKDKVEDRKTWDSFFADSFDKSPALCRQVRTYKNWYMQDLRRVAEEHCKYVTQ